MEIVEEIEITGKNWNDLINLPCVECITKGKHSDIISVELRDGYLPEKYRLKNMPSLRESINNLTNLKSINWQRVYASMGRIGDKLVRYENDTWQIIKKGK